jgi:hypothetical protein
MIIELTPDGCTVTEPDNCTQPHVATTLPTRHDTGSALQEAGMGRLDGDGAHALVDLDQLRTHARASATRADWDSKWEEMIAYATEQGWVSSDGCFVGAHIQTTADAGSTR